MNSCPTCGAAQRGSPQCHRCKSDLSTVLRTEQSAAWHARRAWYELIAGSTEAAELHACRAVRLWDTPATRDALEGVRRAVYLLEARLVESGAGQPEREMPPELRAEIGST